MSGLAINVLPREILELIVGGLARADSAPSPLLRPLGPCNVLTRKP